MNSLVQPNIHTREFIQFCEQEKIESLPLFFQKPSKIEQIKNKLNLKIKNKYAFYSLDYEYCFWFGLTAAVKKNNNKIIELLLNEPKLKPFYTKEALEAFFHGYKLYAELPKIEMRNQNITRNKDYFVQVCISKTEQQTFQYKEIRPIFIDIPLYTCIKNGNIKLFFSLIEKIPFYNFINLDYYKSKFLAYLKKENVEEFLGILNIKEKINLNLNYLLLDIIQNQNEFAIDFLIEHQYELENLLSSLNTKHFNQDEIAFHKASLKKVQYIDLDKKLSTKVVDNSKKSKPFKI